MSKCDERFARQYRYELPPGFPLASPCSDIVHHLSGPNRYAHTQTSLRKSKSVVTTNMITFTFTMHMTLADTHLHICVDSLVRVSRRVTWNLLLPVHWVERTLQSKNQSDQRMRNHTCLQDLSKSRRRQHLEILHFQLRKRRVLRTISLALFKCALVALTVKARFNLIRRKANPAQLKDPSACNTVVSGACNPLFKVLCIFPSRYLFAIGL